MLGDVDIGVVGAVAFTTPKAVGALVDEVNENNDPVAGVKLGAANTDGVALAAAVEPVPEGLKLNGAAPGALVLELFGVLARLKEKLVGAAAAAGLVSNTLVGALLVDEDD